MPSWRSSQASDCRRDGCGWDPKRGNEKNYLYFQFLAPTKRQSAALISAAQHAMPEELKTECLCGIQREA